MRQIVKIASVLSVALWMTGCGQKSDQMGPQERGPMEVGAITIAAQSQSILVELPGRSKAYFCF